MDCKYILPLILSALTWYSCNPDIERSGTYSKENNLITVDVHPNQARIFVLSEWVDSIRFIPLDNEPMLFAAVPDRIKIKDDYVVYSRCKGSGDCNLFVFSLTGEHLLSLHSNPGEKEALVSIREFDVDKDTLYVLHDISKISAFSLADFKKSKRMIYMPDMYYTFVKSASGFMGFTQMSSHALNFVDENGELVDQKLSLAEHPTSNPDWFDHFSSVFNSDDHLFYFKFDPSIYRIDYYTGDYFKVINVNFGPQAVSESEMSELIHAGIQENVVTNRLCNDLQKFCQYWKVLDFKGRTFLSFKMIEKLYMLFLEKRTNNFYLFDLVDNDSGYPFITVNKRLPVYAGFADERASYLALVLDPESVDLNKSVAENPSIPSNWATTIAPDFSPHSNPIIALLKLKKF